MPEYLSPGVYVEEVELLPRPIVGVSTSTTGFVGVTKRGPVNHPVLVTNPDEYLRYFGDFLDEATYKGDRFLPYGVDGFFANGGQRAYVLRIGNLPAPPQANETPYDVVLRATPDQALTAFLDIPTRARSADRELQSDANPNDTTIDLGDTRDLALDSVLQIDEGASAEFVRVTGFGTLVDVAPAIEQLHMAGTPVRVLPDASGNANPTTLTDQVGQTAGAGHLRVADRAGIAQNDWLALEEGGASPEAVKVTTQLAANTSGEGELEIAPTLGEARPQATSAAAYRASNVTVALQGPVTLPTPSVVVAPPPGGGDGIAAGTWLVLGSSGANSSEEAVRVDSLTADPNTGDRTLTLTVGARFPHDQNATVTRLDARNVSTTLGEPTVPLAASIDRGTVVLIQTGNQSDVVRIRAIPGAAPFYAQSTPVPAHAHAANSNVTPVAGPIVPDATLIDAVSDGDTSIRVSNADAANLPRGSIVQILDFAQTEVVHVLDRTAVQNTQNTDVQLLEPLRFPHRTTAGLIALTPGGMRPAIRVIAGPSQPNPDAWPEPGVWGNDISVTISPASVAQAALRAVPQSGAPSIDVVSANGFEPGTIVRLPGNRFARVTNVQGRRIFLSQAVPQDSYGVNAGNLSAARVASVEFKLTFSYGPVIQILDETYDNLSPDPAHSRYYVNVVNDSSLLVHVEDLIDPQNPPARPTDRLPLPGTFSPGGGTDGLAAFADAATKLDLFRGRESSDADRRTGLFALLNVSGISILALPGQTDVDLQLATVAHCEAHKYTFAVLDADRNASLDQVQLQRSQFDSTYAAVYYPWIQILDAWGRRPAFVPPSGHIAGVYARTDDEVGVHKAPANTIVRQARDLERAVTKAQQDVLNPKGINAIRAFSGRGILVWGARTVSTTNPLWRYLSVRRLFIFLEESIDLSTQYAPFEINDVPLWNRLKASIRAFLLVQWRAGALQGATADEAFFVRCGLGETMIQQDIDEGRVIVVVGAAPVKPSEFVIFRIAQTVPGFTG